MQNEHFFLKQTIFSATIAFGVSIVCAAFVLGLSIRALRPHDSAISVIGSTRQVINSDTATFIVTLSQSGGISERPKVFSKLDTDTKKVLEIAKKNAVSKESITENSATVFEQFNYNNGGQTLNGYKGTKIISLSKKEIKKIEDVESLKLALENAVKNSEILGDVAIEYTYSKLPELRVSLLGKATVDAKERAKAIMKESGGNVGKLISAAMGVVQVVPPGSQEVTDYGSYDTTTFVKEIMVTVKARFDVK
jgi:uncharacterized protein